MDKHDYVYCILGFARPDYLSDLVSQIRSYDPTRNIIILVDADPGSNPEISKANDSAQRMALLLSEEKLVRVIEKPVINLGTREALRLLLDEGFLIAPNIVYIEDDLRLTRNPTAFIHRVLCLLHSSDKLAFGTLYSRYTHSLSDGKDHIRISRWPELWGLVMSKRGYQEMQTQSKNSDLAVHSWLAKWYRDNYGRFLAVISRRVFLRTWVSKFERASGSRYAWDTVLHKITWFNDSLAALPEVSLLEDRGVDWTSISQSKRRIDSYHCVIPPKEVNFKNPENSYLFCKWCDLRANIEFLFISSKLKHLLLKCLSTFLKFSGALSKRN